MTGIKVTIQGWMQEHLVWVCLVCFCFFFLLFFIRPVHISEGKKLKSKVNILRVQFICEPSACFSVAVRNTAEFVSMPWLLSMFIKEFCNTNYLCNIDCTFSSFRKCEGRGIFHSCLCMLWFLTSGQEKCKLLNLSWNELAWFYGLVMNILCTIKKKNRLELYPCIDMSLYK
jgi:hypothetical protein